MLDMQRASSHQLNIELRPTHVLNDVFKTVESLVFTRGNHHHNHQDSVKIELVCVPHDLVIATDALRLKQIVLNLVRNAIKFVHTGFVRMRAELVVEQKNGNTVVQISVEDSGPGIPQEKKYKLFQKFQQSLDELNQGTGIGLSLCKTMTTLLGGYIWIDDDYHSGIEGCPGTRFVVDLQTPPLDIPEDDDDEEEQQQKEEKNNNDNVVVANVGEPCCSQQAPSLTTTSSTTTTTTTQELSSFLPQDCKVLFVDDDFILRKLFARSIKRVAPTWKVAEAGNGESALDLVLSGDDNEFDLIFMDQYMASVQKQLLGTETVRAMRSKGVKSIICGLSANDCECGFRDAGADAFLFKPFPCEKEMLLKELVRISSLKKMQQQQQQQQQEATASFGRLGVLLSIIICYMYGVVVLCNVKFEYMNNNDGGGCGGVVFILYYTR